MKAALVRWLIALAVWLVSCRIVAAAVLRIGMDRQYFGMGWLWDGDAFYVYALAFGLAVLPSAVPARAVFFQLRRLQRIAPHFPVDQESGPSTSRKARTVKALLFRWALMAAVWYATVMFASAAWIVSSALVRPRDWQANTVYVGASLLAIMALALVPSRAALVEVRRLQRTAERVPGDLVGRS